ncbi:HNH endonuclease [Lentzea sp. NPDC051838]|uniref:HNH endonuclease n=1 Tax=Lentzea sp. NPDC051838 TaxID=3154849 RepID=UPI0034325E73
MSEHMFDYDLAGVSRLGSLTARHWKGSMRTGRPRVDRVVVSCTCCGLLLERYESVVARNSTGRFFCSKACRDRIGSKPRRKDMATCQQERCGRDFYPRTGSPNRFCSKSCHDIFQSRNGYLKTCPVCQERFRVRPSDEDVWCSRSCYEVGRRTVEGRTKLTSDGYVLVYQPGHSEVNSTGWALQHRVILSDLLGHALPKGSTVHHKNGRRDDNRPSNLELRASQHGAGQNILDLLDWARELLQMYGPDESLLREVAVAKHDSICSSRARPAPIGIRRRNRYGSQERMRRGSHIFRVTSHAKLRRSSTRCNPVGSVGRAIACRDDIFDLGSEP